jgi:hypothetical protein
MRKESEMAMAVTRYLGGSKRTTREVRVSGCIFDVVAYDKEKRLFKLVECKLATSPTSIGRTFGQLASYHAAVMDQGYAFVTAVSRRLPLSFHRLMEATNNATKIQVAFYVALTQKACLNLRLLKSLKSLLPSVGIIRVKPDGHCRGYLLRDGKRDDSISSAKAITIKIRRYS